MPLRFTAWAPHGPHGGISQSAQSVDGDVHINNQHADWSVPLWLYSTSQNKHTVFIQQSGVITSSVQQCSVDTYPTPYIKV